MLELRARFDEQNNIDWSDRLKDAGCRIICGFDEYKVRAKICLITVKEKSGVSHMTQVGTGNYNEKTAELYTDLALITANPVVSFDAVEFFKNMAIANIEGKYDTLLVAPVNFKIKLLELIDGETAKGPQGNIFIKINSLTDIDLIDRLAEASRAGVTVRMIVRGICCLLPGVPGETDNVTVVSIVGRYLEHSRVYSFGNGPGRNIYISSADLMTRNTERRVEIACPVFGEKLKTRLTDMLESVWYDNVKARILRPDGSYVRKNDNRPPVDVQSYFAQKAVEDAARIGTAETGLFKKLLEKLGLRGGGAAD